MFFQLENINKANYKGGVGMKNYVKKKYLIQKKPHTTTSHHAYLISSVLKLDTIELIKFSRIITARIDFQSLAFSPSSRHIDSSASFTIAGGFAMERTSTRCCFLIDFTALK